MPPEGAIEVLRVLALSLEELITYLPDHETGAVFMPDGDGDFINFPAEGVLRVALKILNDARFEMSPDVQELIRELLCVIDMLLSLGEEIDYMWLLDKQRYQIEGPFDDAWLVLRRLARLALQRANSAVVMPKADFFEIMRLGAFTKIDKNEAIRFEVQFPGLEKLLYVETLPSGEKRSVTITIETPTGAVNFDLFVGEAFFHRWDPPHNHDVISGEERDRVIKNISAAFDHLGITFTLSR